MKDIELIPAIVRTGNLGRYAVELGESLVHASYNGPGVYPKSAAETIAEARAMLDFIEAELARVFPAPRPTQDAASDLKANAA